MTAHPYIPNSEPRVRAQMLAAVGAASTEEFYAAIPAALRVDGLLDLPEPFTCEADLVRHVEGLLGRNTSTRDAISFLGAGCYNHHVPAVCDEVNGRSEFLTAYAGEPYEDHGRFQALFEYASMMGELLEMDVVTVPVYDGYQASATALRMCGRITGRPVVLVTTAISADKRRKIADYLLPDMRIRDLPASAGTGTLDEDSLAAALDDDVAGVYLESPNYFGVVETGIARAAGLAHRNSSLLVVSADPISLGVLASPASLGADIACGDIQSLGMHQYFGGGQAGYIAVHDDERFVMELPARLFGLAPTSVPGELGFGDVAYERTSFAVREQGKEWVGTAAALWGITAGVYLALMGPAGMTDIGDTILARTRYAMMRLDAIPGLTVRHLPSPHFREFVVDLTGSGAQVAAVDAALRSAGIFVGKDLSSEFPELGQSILVCVTELTTKADIDRLADLLKEAIVTR
ncbi:MAG TPA: aminomethyl-transferring glycine dehydrogenase subunit GcvPA [Streptosporangiaceae bacterium]|nr:aminomethyl-transferring glycine dehydrogenase subunit GcvPA [Streptosporangiaceae bacterium]